MIGTTLFDTKIYNIMRDPRDNIRSILNRLNLPGNQSNLTKDQVSSCGSLPADCLSAHKPAGASRVCGPSAIRRRGSNDARGARRAEIAVAGRVVQSVAVGHSDTDRYAHLRRADLLPGDRTGEGIAGDFVWQRLGRTYE